MDHHFNRMLDVSSGSQERFLPSNSFTGSKLGYYFGKGELGLGYYLDARQSKVHPNQVDEHSTKKRKLNETDVSESIPSYRNGQEGIDVDAYIANAELNTKVELLTDESLRQVFYFYRTYYS